MQNNLDKQLSEFTIENAEEMEVNDPPILLLKKRPTLFSPKSLTRRSTDRQKSLKRVKSLTRKSTATSKNILFQKPEERLTAWTRTVILLSCCFTSNLLEFLGVPVQKQQSWREKWALCFIGFVMSLATIFFLIFFNNLVCPATATDNTIPANVFGKIHGLM